MQLRHSFQKDRPGVYDGFDGLTRFGIRREPDEVTRVAGSHGFADLAVRLEPADARTVTRAGIDHDKGALLFVDDGARRRFDSHHPVVDRPGQLSPIDDQFTGEMKHVRDRLGHVLPVLIASPAHHVQVENGALACVDDVIHPIPGALKRVETLNFHLILLFIMCRGGVQPCRS